MNLFKFRLGKHQKRQAFTLVELLLVIAIIAVLASMAVGVMASAQRDAAESATRSRISMLETLFQAELENYEVRRSPVPFNVIGGLVNAVPDTTWADSGFAGAAFLIHAKNMKRMIMADVIRAEMPDGTVSPLANLTFPTPVFRNYLDTQLSLDPNNLIQFAPKSVYRWTGREVNSAADNSENLYTILSRIDLDGTPAVDSLGSLAIGDTDADGLKEIVDAWGEPIVFQFRQQEMTPLENRATPGVFQGVWTDENSFTGLATVANFPVQVSQIRVFFTSERLREIDGEEPDYVGPPINFF